MVDCQPDVRCGCAHPRYTMRAELIGHFKPCMTEIDLHIDARMADYIRTHPYLWPSLSDTCFGRWFTWSLEHAASWKRNGYMRCVT